MEDIHMTALRIAQYILAYMLVGGVLVFVVEIYIQGFDKRYRTALGFCVFGALWPAAVVIILMYGLSKLLEQGYYILAMTLHRLGTGENGPKK